MFPEQRRAFRPKNPSVLLSGKRIWINSQADQRKAISFEKIWEPIVELLGATVVHGLDEGGVDVLITDATATKETVDAVKAQGGSVVSSEWLIQVVDSWQEMLSRP